MADARQRVPGLLLFLGLGMAVGSEGLGWVSLDDYALAQRVGVVALGLILFEGGLTSGVREIRGVLAPALSLAFVGTLLTAVITGVVAAALLGESLLKGLLLGSVLASTDSAATFALLRSSTLRRRVAWTLEGEAGFNDPIAVLLVLSFITAIHAGASSAGGALVLFARELGIGLGVGLAVGWLALTAIRRLPLGGAGLYPVASLATAGLAYGVVERLRTRHDVPGSLVVLADGRFAITGPTAAVGGSDQIQRYARSRLGLETEDAARAWWQEVIGAVLR